MCLHSQWAVEPKYYYLLEAYKRHPIVEEHGHNRRAHPHQIQEPLPNRTQERERTKNIKNQSIFTMELFSKKILRYNQESNWNLLIYVTERKYCRIYRKQKKKLKGSFNVIQLKCNRYCVKSILCDHILKSKKQLLQNSVL